MPINVTIEQIITIGGIVVAGAGAYHTLKGKLGTLARECELRNQGREDDIEGIKADLKENDDEVQKVWSKMLTKDGHTQECTIMNLRVEKAIKESSEAVTEKVQETMIDFQKQFAASFEDMKKTMVENGKARVDG